MHFPGNALWLLGIIALFITSCGGGDNGGSTGTGDEGDPQGSFTILSVNLAYADESIGKLGTNTYQFTPNSSSVHEIGVTATQSDLSWALFDDPTFTSNSLVNCDVHFLVDDEVCRTPVLTEGISYYLTVDEWENVAGTFTLLIGTPTFSPVSVATPYPGEPLVGYGDHFYQFTPATTSAYSIDITATQSDLSWALYDEPGMASPPLVQCDTFQYSADEICQSPVLTVGNTYFLSVSEWEGLTGTYTLLIDTPSFNMTTVGASYPGESISPYGKSYYQFTPGITSVHTIQVTAASSDLSWALYDDPTLSSLALMDCDKFQIPGDEVCQTPVLSNLTTYYLVVDEWDILAGTFTLEINLPSFRPVTVGVALPGEMISSTGSVFYQFTAAGDGIHTISLTATGSDLSWALYDDPTFSSAPLSECDLSFVPGDEICPTPPLTGGALYYLLVKEWDVVEGSYTLQVNLP